MNSRTSAIAVTSLDLLQKSIFSEFTQLAVELMAVERAKFSESQTLYGAVSIGNIWQFAVLQVQEKQIIQDLNLYRIPADLAELLQIVIGILERAS